MEVVHIKKILARNLLIYIGLHCLYRSSWTATTLAILSSKDHLGIYARSQKKDQKEAEPKMIKARAVTIVEIQALIDFYHFAVPFSQFICLIRELFLYRICTFNSTPTPWLTRICFTQISLTRLFKKIPIPHLTRSMRHNFLQ